ncbi:MAG: hypothetical protein ACAI35_08780, partial [Candidatus Methylacidiphilales bacterium]
MGRPGRKPARESVREHLLHLIGSHHDTREFGATVRPRTPEAWMLHYIDNIDAKFEMMSQTYKEKPQVAPQVYDFRCPLARWEALAGESAPVASSATSSPAAAIAAPSVAAGSVAAAA